MNRFTATVAAFALAAGCALAQTNPVIAEQKTAYENNRNNFIKAAEKMPEENYSFKPMPEMQSFGDRVAHIAGQMGNCSSVTGERKLNPAQGKTTKADIARHLGIKKQNLTRWKKVPPHYVAQLSELTGLPREYILPSVFA